ncbi:MAG: HlyC/CorC family transporter [Planctomycetes bacterium]|nr:HlyC/CorC family transporter [Planctomycetota bacterium]
MDIPLTSHLAIIALLVSLVLLLLASAFFSGSETALFALSKVRLEFLAERRDNKALLIRRLMSQPDRLLATILVGNNIVNVLVSVIGTTLCLIFFGTVGLIIAPIAMTLLLLVIGEITPKVMASQFSERIAFLLVRPLNTLVAVLYPVTALFTFVVNKCFAVFGLKVEYKPHRFTRDEIRHLIRTTAETGHLKREEHQLLHRVFEFHDKLVKDVMVPRSKIHALSVNTTTAQLLDVIAEGGHTRFPVCDGDLDHIVGVIHAKDVINMVLDRQLFVLQDLIREAQVVLEDAHVSDLLAQFRKGRFHMAIVRNAPGQVVGLVTLEDVLEEIVGEIGAEHTMPFEREG